MGEQFLVNAYVNNWQDDPDVVALRDGGFLIAWDSFYNEYDDGPAAYVVAAQRYDANGRRIGGEFLLDGVDGAASTAPALAPLAGGGFAVAFSYAPDGILGRTQAWTRSFGEDGAARDEGRRVDTIEQFEAVAPRVAALKGGGSIAFYEADRSGRTFDDVYWRLFDEDGAPLGRETRMNTRKDDFDQGIVESARLSSGRVVAVWNSEATLERSGGRVAGNEVRASVFSPDGAPVRSDVHLASNFGSAGGGNGQGYDVAALGGGFVLSQKEYGHALGTDYLYHVLIQTFDANARPTSGRFSVHRTEEPVYGTSIATLASGDVAVVWQQQSETRGEIGDDVMGRIFSADGRALTSVFEVGADFSRYDEQADPAVAALKGGGFVVTFSHDNLDGDSEGIAARVFGQATDGADRRRVDASGFLNGGKGGDALIGNGKANALRGEAGDDRLRGEGARDDLLGGSGDDRLYGGSGGDRLVGGGGGDRLYGGSGGDRLGGGAGRDRLYAGDDGARDAFVFGSAEDSRGAARDSIFGFDRGEDVLDLRAIDARSGGRDDAFRYADATPTAHGVWWTKSGGDVVAAADVDGDRRADFETRIVDVSSLSADDVLL